MHIFEITLFGIRIAPTYYGLAYALWMLGAYYWVFRRSVFQEKYLDILLYWVIAGIILWGRLGYVFLYNLPYYLEHPEKILAIYEGGMSFHWGIVGVILALIGYVWTNRKDAVLQRDSERWWIRATFSERLLRVGDEVAVMVPLGIFLGRIANYLNHELVGYAGYTWPFAMVRSGVSHFPSPLLEAVWEGLILGIILVVLQGRIQRTGVVSGAFLVGYALIRMLAEAFFRLPDPQIGYLALGMSLGFWLSVVVLLGGIWLLYYCIFDKKWKADTLSA